jgi:lysozyme
MPITGIDVSHMQAEIDWTSVASAGFSFACAKATEGLTISDAQFQNNWNGIASANLLRGAYHFFHPSDDSTAQANHFLAALTSANGSATLGVGDLPATLDVESTADTVPPAQLCSSIQTWLDTVQAATGRVPIIYTNAGFWNTATGGSTAFGSYPLWVAEYGVAAPKLPVGWSAYTIWQWSEAQTVAGITTPVDADTFNGTLDALQALAAVTAATS